MIKIITVIGARPQMIKASAISREIKANYQDKITEIIIHTGQHYDENMSQIFFDELDIPKEKYNLEVGSGSHAYQTANIMLKLEPILMKEKPNYLLLYGDTNSTIAAALCAVKLFIPIIHIEAGVRAYNKDMPEEVNRILTDHLSTLLFTPTKAGYDALVKEGFHHDELKQSSYNNPGFYLCGDIMYDNTLYFKSKVNNEVLFSKFGINDKYVLFTMHRPSNVDNEFILSNILKTVLNLADENQTMFVFPIHPRTLNSIEKIKDTDLKQKFLNHKNIKLLPPASFIEMIGLESQAEMIITDSGGVQKEAYFLRKPCLIMLEETPWIELIESKCAKLVGNDPNKIREGFHYYYQNDDLVFDEIYGSGDSSKFILKTIINHYQKKV